MITLPLAAKTRQEMHFLSTEEKPKWIHDYVERDTTVSMNQIKDAKEAVQQEQKI
jgi:hypothetical protein